ncbi:uncharacterized protein LOC128236123 isoform X2 [Mya arenaria]|uniref:uncharacterized protein LOC128236123 isoform X2 n=1 Tax=Mya arenaria TaxID=6604 RepID=UPI0022E2F555|nr:uncharacterized protein LOC128236123 isoform X2 [Mya arenaria]
MQRQWMIVFAQLAVLNSFLLASVCAAENKYGTISVEGPAFVNREVTLKATPFYPWGCDVEWKYMKVGETTFQTITGTNIKRYSEDGSFILKWKASNEYNGSTFYAGCSKNQTIKTSMTSINFTERPSYPVLGPKSPDFNTTECIYVYESSEVYCQTENGTEPVQVLLLIGQVSYVLSESEGNKGSYRLYNAYQQMAGMLRQNVTCQVSYSAQKTQYEVRGNLCNVETGSLPFLTVPEFLQRESSLYACEVRNAIPAPTIEIYVDKVLLGDVQQTDTFNESSHTFTSSAKVTMANKFWKGQEVCCTRSNRYDFGQKEVSVCKNISMKYPSSEISMSVNKIHEYHNTFYVCLLNISCETNESNPPCTIEWSSDIDSLRNARRYNWTYGDSGSYRVVSNVLQSFTEDMVGGTITCSSRCHHFPSRLYKDYKISVSEFFMETAIIDGYISPKILNLTCHSGETCIPCTIVWSSNSVYLYPISTSQWTKNSGSGYTAVSNALYFITNDVDGKQIQCSAKCGNDSSDSKHETYTISFQAFQESATIYASVVTQQWHTAVLCALSGTLLLALVTKLTVLLLRRCKPHAYERFLRRRGPVASDPSRHVYDVVQSTVETTALHALRMTSAIAPDNLHTPQLSVMADNQVRNNRNVCHYDYVDTSSVQQDQTTAAGNYIHAI